MASKAITIYTPEGTPAHIGAQDDAFIHDAMVQGRSGIFGDLICGKVNNNTVMLSGGGAVNRGYIMYVPAGETHELEIYNCDGAMLRRDIIASVFTKGDGNTADRHEFQVIMGEEDAELPFFPELVTSELETAGDINQVALFGVLVNGEGIVSIDALSDNTAVPHEAHTAQTAHKLSEVRRFELMGDLSGIGVFDGGNDMTAAVSVIKVKGYEVFIQESEPMSPRPGDIWLWQSAAKEVDDTVGSMRFDGSGWVEISIRRRFDGERWTELEGRRRTADGWTDLWDGSPAGGGSGSGGSDDDDVIVDVEPGTGQM